MDEVLRQDPDKALHGYIVRTGLRKLYRVTSTIRSVLADAFCSLTSDSKLASRTREACQVLDAFFQKNMFVNWRAAEPARRVL